MTERFKVAAGLNTGSSSMAIDVKALGRRIGAEISDFDARRADTADIEQLKRHLATHGVLALRDQNLQPAELKSFGDKFGKVEFAIRDAFRLADQPEVYVISNVVKDGKPIGNPNDGFFWHTDASYMAHPTAYTFLYCLETPPSGAETQFATAFQAYDELDEDDRVELEGMTAVHSHDRIHAARKWAMPLTEEERARAPDSTHPLVRTHPISGRKAIYLGTKRGFYPNGLNEEERIAFIDKWVGRVTQPGNVYSHKWRVKDLVIWDNRGLLHRATEYDKEKYRRIMHRVSVSGERPY
jgi:taurine dioxygenase